jgi:hypothetical protein
MSGETYARYNQDSGDVRIIPDMHVRREPGLSKPLASGYDD